LVRVLRSWAWAGVVLLAACGGGAPEKPGAAGKAPLSAEGEARVETHGFRSAQFGMTEAQVRDAVAKDYHVGAGAIRAEENVEEKTHILAVTVPEVLPQGGTAEIAYVFGHASGKLTQVGITWSAKTDPAETPEQLTRNARRLAEHFKQAGYRPSSIATDVPLKGGTLVFRGSDKVGHATMLVLYDDGKGPGKGQGGGAQKGAGGPTALTLYYLSDPERPDVETPAPDH
jgi:hypothetical protein